MGGRGSSFGISTNSKKYGTEFKSLLQVKNIKFVQHVNGSATAPMETMTRGRIYVTVNKQGKLKNIAFYDKNNKRYKQIDIAGKPHYIDGKPVMPHTHLGYEHSENGTRAPTDFENIFINVVKAMWYNNKRG